MKEGKSKTRICRHYKKKVDAQTVREQLLQNIIDDTKKNKLKAIIKLIITTSKNLNGQKSQ
jgi:hypothetical protein